MSSESTYSVLLLVQYYYDVHACYMLKMWYFSSLVLCIILQFYGFFFCLAFKFFLLNVLQSSYVLHNDIHIFKRKKKENRVSSYIHILLAYMTGLSWGRLFSCMRSNNNNIERLKGCVNVCK